MERNLRSINRGRRIDSLLKTETWQKTQLQKCFLKTFEVLGIGLETERRFSLSSMSLSASASGIGLRNMLGYTLVSSVLFYIWKKLRYSNVNAEQISVTQKGTETYYMCNTYIHVNTHIFIWKLWASFKFNFYHIKAGVCGSVWSSKF